jgi:AmmeMemoRadiSam system protein A
MISQEEKRELLVLAREAITRAVTGVWTARTSHPLPGLARPCGLFVTLKQEGQLRGCIGHIESTLPLGELVGEIAVKSALEDPRFAPLTPEELGCTTIQLSILSPLRKIRGIGEVIVGTHGLMLELGPHRGLLLPQVAAEFHWGAEAFLEATARKAGLHRDAWRDSGAKLFVFTAEIIDESEVLHGTPPDRSTV